MKPNNPSAENEGLRVVAYAGDNKILVAVSLDDDRINQTDRNLAGFAIWRTVGNKEQILSNRINFDIPITNATTAADRKWTPLDQAPFQKFRWIDVPPDGFGTPITYRVQALYFTGQDHATKPGPSGTAHGQSSHRASHQVPTGLYPRLYCFAGLCRQVPQRRHPP
jgi:hypothetical protein